MDLDCDALVIGAGPAGSAAAILLATAGWRVELVERTTYPRRKVCGECIAAANLPLLDELGIGAQFRRAAGPALTRVGWIDAAGMISAEMPACDRAADAFGRVLGRDQLDQMLLERARTVGVIIHQPATVRRVVGEPGEFVSTLELRGALRVRRSHVLIDAHGSWERGPPFVIPGAPPAAIVHVRRRASDLFGFKANFRGSDLPDGLLPVLALPGGYGGMVLGDGGRTTLACCLRRDTLAACRAALPRASAGAAVEAFVQRACPTVREMLESAQRDGPWLSVGPLRPGIRLRSPDGAFRVGNAAGESHPLIGEGISMALQSAFLAAAVLTQQPARHLWGQWAADAHLAYATAWRRAFTRRLEIAALYAHVAMRPGLASPARTLISRWPSLLGRAARLAGKASPAPLSQLIPAEIR